MVKAIKFVEENSHQSLWKIIADKSLLDLDFLNAERALLKIDDFKTLKYVKRLQQLDDREKQRAEILTLQGKYEEAEKVYRTIERKDLAINMKVKIGDFYGVLEMVKEGSGYD